MEDQKFREVRYKELRNQKGVYVLSCNGYSYVGSSVNLYVRLKAHCNSLRKGNHYNSFLQNLANKHSIDSFTYKVLEFCDNYVEREAFYIKFLNPRINVEKDPQSKVKSQSTKDKISESLKGKGVGSKNPAAISVYQYSLDGEYIGEFECAKDAAKVAERTLAALSGCLNGRSKSCGDYLWSKKRVERMSMVPDKPKGPRKGYRITFEN